MQKCSSGACSVAVRVDLERVDLERGAVDDAQPTPTAPTKSIVLDAHADTPTEWLEHPFDLSQPSPRQVDFPKMRAGGVDAEVFVAYVPAKHADHDAFEFCKARIVDIHRMVDAHPSDAQIATSSDDVRRIAASGRRAILVGVEGGHAIEDSLEKLGDLYRLGARYMTLTHFNTNHWADSSGDEPLHHGLTPMGEDVVREMNRLGMMVDVSHVSDETFWDVLSVSAAPVLASHSSARALCDAKRNMSDEMLRAIGEKHGVVMVNFLSMYVSCKRSKATLAMVVDHIEHVARVAGVDAVGLGSDFDNDVDFPVGLEDVSHVGAIAEELRRRGRSDDDVKKIMGENFMRLFAEVERAAKK